MDVFTLAGITAAIIAVGGLALSAYGDDNNKPILVSTGIWVFVSGLVLFVIDLLMFLTSRGR